MGGVSERPRRQTGRSDPSRVCRGRDGRRHSGSRESGLLRGRSMERGPRSVRLVSLGVPPRERAHRRQRVSRGRRGGERRRRTPQSVRTRREGHRASRRSGTRPSLGPLTRARQSSLNFVRRKLAKVARSARYRGRANPCKREEPAPGSGRADVSAARRASPLPQGRSCVTRQKRKEVQASVPARIESSGQVPARRNAVAEVGRRASGLE